MALFRIKNIRTEKKIIINSKRLFELIFLIIFTFIKTNNEILLYSNYIRIKINIKHPGIKYIYRKDNYYSGTDIAPKPDKVYINGNLQNRPESNYNLTEENNDIVLIWNENIRSTNSLFRGSDIQEIDLSNFNTSKLINIRYMFYECKSLKSINLTILIHHK